MTDPTAGITRVSLMGHVRTAARAVASALSSARARLHETVFVPVPPSKAREHAEYDDRMVWILEAVDEELGEEGGGLDIRDMLSQSTSMEAAHHGHRHSVEELIACYRVDKELATRPWPSNPPRIVLVDDLLTQGNHFVAAKAVLRATLPEATVFGLFLARRIYRPSYSC